MNETDDLLRQGRALAEDPPALRVWFDGLTETEREQLGSRIAQMAERLSDALHAVWEAILEWASALAEAMRPVVEWVVTLSRMNSEMCTRWRMQEGLMERGLPEQIARWLSEWLPLWCLRLSRL